MGRLGLSLLLWGCRMVVPQSYVQSYHVPSNSSPRYTPQRTKTQSHKACSRMLTAALFLAATEGNNPMSPPADDGLTEVS